MSYNKKWSIITYIRRIVNLQGSIALPLADQELAEAVSACAYDSEIARPKFFGFTLASMQDVGPLAHVFVNRPGEQPPVWVILAVDGEITEEFFQFSEIGKIPGLIPLEVVAELYRGKTVSQLERQTTKNDPERVAYILGSVIDSSRLASCN